jgi:3-hydroxybutyryl-CoA dehydratase
MTMNDFDTINDGDTFTGSPFAVTRDAIRDFAEGSLDFNPLHLDDNYMQGQFGKTRFQSVIMHGMTNYGLLSRMMTDWLGPRGGVYRRMETRWLAPAYPGDTITPSGKVKQKNVTGKSRWMLFEVEMRNQKGELTAAGEAMAEFPPVAA